MKILLVEDDASLAENIAEFLTHAGHVVDFTSNGQTALNLATMTDADYDVCVLDLMLPDMDGLTVARMLRQLPHLQLPILMLTARDTVDDKLAGFSEGADDYVVKPFSLHELLARLEVLQRHKHGASPQTTLEVADLRFDIQQQRVERAGQVIELRPSPRKVLMFLMSNSHRVVTKDELSRLLWGDDAPDSDALRVYLHQLRKQVDADHACALIHTIRGQGYRCYAEG